jgi:hypothetical protein
VTWAERVGDLATNMALVLINFARIFSLLLRILSEKLDEFVTGLGERSEAGLTRTATPGGNTWIGLPAAVLWGVAAVVLRALSIVTVFARQLFAAIDEFFRVLAEGQNPRTPA